MEDTKPFIKLFKTPLGYYCYDVNTFSMLRITKGMYLILKCNEIKFDEEAHNRIEKLKEKGYLSKHRPKEMKHPYTDIMEDYLKHNIRKITLQVTQNCNLACKYCAYANPKEGMQRHHENKNMSINLAKKGIDFLFAHSDNEEEINIGFYGGEPLLEFDKIKILINYADNIAIRKNRKVSYSLTTNATILKDEFIEYFMKHDIHILISLDGPKDIHNKNRIYRKTGKGSFNDVMKNLEIIKKRFPKFLKQITLNSVIDTENDFSCYNEFFTNYETINELRLSTNSINKTMLSNDFRDTDIYIKQYKYEKFKLFLSMLNIINVDNVSKIVEKNVYEINKIGKAFNSLAILKDSFHHGGPCITGASRLFMDINGVFFPCERCSENSEVMSIGNINTGIIIEAAKRLMNIGQLTEAECLSCWNVRFCLLCAIKADNITSLSREKKLKHCNDMKKNTASMIYDYLMLREYGYDYNEVFKYKME